MPDKRHVGKTKIGNYRSSSSSSNNNNNEDMTAARLKRGISHVNAEEDSLTKRKRLTRSTFGSTHDIPIVLDSSSSDSESSLDELEKLEQVLAQGRVVAAAAAAKKKGIRGSAKTEPAAERNGAQADRSDEVKSIRQRKHEKLAHAAHTAHTAHTKDAPAALPKNEITAKKTTVDPDDREKGKEKQDLHDAKTEGVVETLAASTPPSSSSHTSTRASQSPSSSSTDPALNLDSRPRLKPALKSALKSPSKHGSPQKPAKRVTIDTTSARISSSISTPIRRLKISLPNSSGNSSDNALVANTQLKNAKNQASDNGSTATAVVAKLDPKNQKPYRDTYSICCISCSKKNRSEYCNKQKPCDICTGKKLKNCQYPTDATVAIPAVRKSAKPHHARSPASPVKAAQLNNASVDKKQISTVVTQPLAASQTKKKDVGVDSSRNSKSTDHALLPKKVEVEANFNLAPTDSPNSESSESCVDDSKSKLRVGTSELKNLKVNVNSPPISRPGTASQGSTVEETSSWKSSGGDARAKSRKKQRVIPSSEDEDIDSMADYEDNSSANLSSHDDSDDYSRLDDDSDVDIDDDDDDDDGKAARKKGNVDAKRRKSRKRSTTPQDNFSRAQKILKTLEFEKRDIGDIYVPTTRRKRNATKENYYIPSDQEDNGNDVEGNGYAAAEARNEQLILSEDEQERRILRGEIGLDYIKSMRNEREKYNHYSSDSLSSSDAE